MQQVETKLVLELNQAFEDDVSNANIIRAVIDSIMHQLSIDKLNNLSCPLKEKRQLYNEIGEKLTELITIHRRVEHRKIPTMGVTYKHD